MTDPIEAAKAPGVFNLENFLVNASYPVEEITIHVNAFAVNEKLKALKEAAALETRIAHAVKDERADQKRTTRTVSGDAGKTSSTALVEERDALQSVIEKWDAEVAKSALTLQLRGMPPYVVEAITTKHFSDKKKDYSGEPEETARDNELIAKSIIKMIDPDGNETTEVTPENIDALRNSLLEGEFGKIINATAHVNLNGVLFDQATDASFLGRRINLAG